MNVRHISIFQEFFFQAQDVTSYEFINNRNIACIYLNQSNNYKITKLSIDIGCSTLESSNYYNILSFPAFPLRFFLSEDPIPAVIPNYPTTSLIYDGISSPSDFPIKQIDRLDSSNQSSRITPYAYSNFLELSQTTPSFDYNNTQVKTNTVAEFNFFSFNQTYGRIASGIGEKYDALIVNNDISDFNFNSNNESNLAIAIFPRISIQKADQPSALLRLKLNYTINFDLIEENL